MGDSNATDGLYYARSDPNYSSGISQSFTLPSDVATLKFDTSFTLVASTFTARIYPVGQESNYINLMGSNQGLGFFGGFYWSRYSANVAALAGQDVTIDFVVTKGSGSPTVLIDNVQMVSGFTPEPVAAVLLVSGAGWMALRRSRHGRRDRC